MAKKQIQTTLITGASSGIGAALAREYASAGVRLHLLGRDGERLRQVANDCRAKGAEVRTARIDVTDADAMRAYIEKADSEMPIDIVIANAGISAGFAGEGAQPNRTSPSRGEVGAVAPGGGSFSTPVATPTRPAGDLPHRGGDVLSGAPNAGMDKAIEAAQKIFDVNVQGVLNTIHPILPLMMKRQSGHIAIMSSLAGIRALPSAPAYSASKAAVRYYGDALRGVVAARGVHVSVICPGWIETPLVAKNTFPMPCIMSAARAATIIKHGIMHRKTRIAFPRRLYFPLALIASLPNFLTDPIFARLPGKAPIP